MEPDPAGMTMMYIAAILWLTGLVIYTLCHFELNRQLRNAGKLLGLILAGVAAIISIIPHFW